MPDGKLKVKSVPYSVPYARPLPRIEFARALRLGLGRARIDVRRHGLAGREDLLVAACLRSATLDPQMEGSTSSFLLAIAKDGHALPAVRRAVLAAAVRPIRNRRDVEHVAWIVATLAERGDSAAQRALLRMVDVQAPRYFAGAQQAVWALGERGWRHVLRAFGPRWTRATRQLAPYFGFVVWTAESELGVRRALAVLREEAARRPDVRPILAFVESTRRERRTRRRTGDEPVQATLDDLERLVSSRARSSLRLQRWTRSASRADREEAWRRVFEERVAHRLRRRLWAWGGSERPPPLDRRLFRLASHPDQRVRRGAVHVLSRQRSPRVRTVALRALRCDPRRSIDDGVLDLLELNARTEDAALVTASLPTPVSPATAHEWARGAEHVAARRRGSQWDALLLRAYDVNPCRWCREFLLETLVERRIAPPTMLREALWDANDDVRRVARNALRPG